jgi:hypothetical protein
VIPKLRDVAYLSAKAFVHIGLQRRCITQYHEHEQDSLKSLSDNHRLVSSGNHLPDSDLAAVAFMVDMTLGHDGEFSWKELEITPHHRAWVSHVFLYQARDEGRVPKVIIDFVEDSLSPGSPSDGVVTDCFFIIGLMIGVPFHVNDTTVKDKRSDFNV